MIIPNQHEWAATKPTNSHSQDGLRTIPTAINNTLKSRHIKHNPHSPSSIRVQNKQFPRHGHLTQYSIKRIRHHQDTTNQPKELRVFVSSLQKDHNQ